MIENRIAPILTQNLMLKPNLKSVFQKNLKRSSKTPKTKKHNFFSVYYDRNFDLIKIKVLFSCSAPSK